MSKAKKLTDKPAWTRLPAYTQLAHVGEALERAGWQRLNGGTWANPLGDYRARTAYTYGIATLWIECVPGGEEVFRYEGEDLLYALVRGTLPADLQTFFQKVCEILTELALAV